MDNTSDYQQMECSRRRDKNSSKMKEENSPSESGLKDVGHMRTKSDITPSLSSSGSGGKSSRSFSLSRSKSIASARDKWKFSNSYGLLPFLNRDLKQHNLNQSLEKCSEDSDSLRLRLNTESQERQRLEREVGRLVKMTEQYQEEILNLRDQHKQFLALEGGPHESLSLMYSNLLRKYEALSEEYNKVVKSHNDAVNKTDQYQDQLKQYKNSYENILNERNKYKQQCTQAIRQWDNALVENSRLKEELGKTRKEKEELLKENEQAMNIRVKASQDIKRLTAERNSALHEYSIIMSERETVHKEMEKLQEELQGRAVMNKELELLQREIRAAMTDRDKAMKDLHEMRRKMEDKENMNPGNMNGQKDCDDNSFNKALEEVKKLRAEKTELESRVQAAVMEADVAKGRRDWAFSERDKIMLESEGVQLLCDKLRKERDKAMSDLADRIKDFHDTKKQNNVEEKMSLEKKDFAIKKENDEKRNDFVSKMIPRGETETTTTASATPAKAVSKMFSSSERVYSLSTNTPTQGKESKKPWAQLTETFKEKLDLVKGRRQSAEQAEDEEKVDFLAQSDRVEKLGRKTSDSESDCAEGGGENGKYGKFSLENLDHKIQEMKQNKAGGGGGGPTGRSNILQQLRNPQDVVQSHVLQVQSMFQETLAAGQHQHQQNNKNDYFLGSSASETSLNDSLKSGNLEEHEVVSLYPNDHDKSSLTEEDCNLEDKDAVISYDVKSREIKRRSSSSSWRPQQTCVTSPKRTSPFPAVKAGGSQEYSYHNLRSPGALSNKAYCYPSIDSLYSKPSSIFKHNRQTSSIYGCRQLPIVPHVEVPPLPSTQPYSSLPPDPAGGPGGVYSRFSYPSSLALAGSNRLSLASTGGGNRLSMSSIGHYHPLSPPAMDQDFHHASSGEVFPVFPPDKPNPGDIRQFHIEKSGEQLGIKIEEVNIQGEMAGIFISSVSGASLAARVGLHVGDQLLEVCGINLRTAKYQHAAQVLQTAGKSVDIKVQFNPDKFEVRDNSRASVDSLYGYKSPSQPLYKSTPIRSESQLFQHANSLTEEPKSRSSTLKSALNLELLPAAHSTLLGQQQQQEGEEEEEEGMFQYPARFTTYKSRLLQPVLRRSGELGVRLVGGNKVGIFIHSVDPQSPAGEVGLQCGDQILEYNGTDLRSATAEQAAYELAKPVDKVIILAQYNPDKYREIKDSPGDSYFIRAMFDRQIESEGNSGSLQLCFEKDDILLVDNTMYNGVPGNWSAWSLDKDGKKVKWGLIPSKYKVEESLLLKRAKGKTFSDGVYEFSNSTRRSFLRKIRGGDQSNTKQGPEDCKELAVYSDVESLLSHTDTEKLNSQLGGACSYLRVEKRSFTSVRSEREQ